MTHAADLEKIPFDPPFHATIGEIHPCYLRGAATAGTDLSGSSSPWAAGPSCVEKLCHVYECPSRHRRERTKTPHPVFRRCWGPNAAISHGIWMARIA